MYHQYNIQILT